MDKRKFNWTGVLNRIWAYAFFFLMLIPLTVEYEEKLDKTRRYIFCPNHFSYLDIPTMGLIYLNTIFVGKSSMEKIPVFGWMYKKLHITVDRASLKSRYSTFVSSIEAIKEGKNLVIYPEGGIITREPPEMGRFKDGPFKIAISTQTPIVPVSIVNNWKILPENLLMRHMRMKVIVHKPVETTDLTLSDMPTLKSEVFEKISEGLNGD